MKEEAQLSQTGRATLRFVGNFAESLSRNYTVETIE